MVIPYFLFRKKVGKENLQLWVCENDEVCIMIFSKQKAGP